MAEDYWKQLVQGSKYAERMPIGLEDVIRGANGALVRGLYARLYRPSQMAAVIVGDFESASALVAMLEEEFGSEPPLVGLEREALMAPPVPVPVPVHAVPRISTFEDAEATSCEVLIECKQAKAEQTATADSLRKYILTNLFADLLNQRFYALSKRDDAPFFAASAGNQLPCRSLESYTLTASTPEGTVLRALRTLLEEVERVRRFGWSEREIAVVKANYLTELKTSYIERNQFDSGELARECCGHFLSGEILLGIEMEVRASKAILEQVSGAELQNMSSNWNWQSSCVIKVVMPKRRCGSIAPSEPVLRAVLEDVLRGTAELAPWEAESSRQSLRELFAADPAPGGRVLSREADEVAGFEKLTLSNGLTLLVKQTQLQHDELLIGGFSRGGLSELPSSAYYSGALCDLIATESGAFGCSPRELAEILAGVSVAVSTEHSMYQHRFWAECSPRDLESCLQLLHLLFTTRRHPTRPALKQIKQLLMEGVINQQRDPHVQWRERVTAVNTCGHPCFRKPTLWDVRAVDPLKACALFDASFASPGQFTLVMVGSVDMRGRMQTCPECRAPAAPSANPTPLARQGLGGAGRAKAWCSRRPCRGFCAMYSTLLALDPPLVLIRHLALPLLEAWLASIPAPVGSNAPLEPEALRVLPVSFPSGVVTERVVLPMVEPSSASQLTWPISLDASRPIFLQCHEIGLVCKLFEARLLKRLRFADSNVYSVSVGIDFGSHSIPDPGEPARGTLQISFSSDPDRAKTCAESAQAELRLLCTEGPTAADVSSQCEITRREHEEAKQTNHFWVERLRQAAFSQRASGGVSEKMQSWEAERVECLNTMNPAAVKRILQALLPHASTNYSHVTLLPSQFPTCGLVSAVVHESLVRCAAPSWDQGK